MRVSYTESHCIQFPHPPPLDLLVQAKSIAALSQLRRESVLISREKPDQLN